MTTCTRRPSSTWSHCACPACVKRTARTRKLHAAGSLPATRSDAAWAEIDTLLGRGWTPGAIAAAAGIPDRTIIGALTRRRDNGSCTFARTTAERILNRAPIPPRGRIPAEPYRRRLRALCAIGWTLESLAEQTGQNLTTLAIIAAGGTVSILGPTAQIIADLYARLSMTPGPSMIARRRAEREGWVAPLGWDDIDTDEAPILGAQHEGDDIDHTAVERTLAGDRVPLTRPERVEVIRRLAQRGLSDTEMGELIGITGRSVQRIRAEFGINTGWVAA